jgi:hypothetical protein
MLGCAPQARQARMVMGGRVVALALEAKDGGVFSICFLQPRSSLHGV